MTAGTGGGPDRVRPRPELARAISPHTVFCPADRPVVSGDDLAELRSIVRDRRGDPSIARSRAVRALAQSDRSPDTAAVMARVAADDGESIGARIHAAAALSTLPSDLAEPHLLDLLDVPEVRVRTQVVKALGWIGTQRSLTALERHDPADGRLARRILTARLVIAHRANAPIEQIDRIREQVLSGETVATGAPAQADAGAPGERWETVASSPLQKAAAEALVGGPAAGPVSALAGSVGLEFVCEKERNVVLLSAEIAERDLVQEMLAKSMIAGVVAVDDHGGNQLGVRFRLLTAPRGDTLEIMAVTSVGEPAFIGTGERGEDGLSFRLRALDAPVPVEIHGTIASRSVGLELRVRDDIPPRPARTGVAVAAGS